MKVYRELKYVVQVIEVPGYTEEEKIQIAVRHLLPKQLEVGSLY